MVSLEREVPRSPSPKQPVWVILVGRKTDKKFEALNSKHWETWKILLAAYFVALER